MSFEGVVSKNSRVLALYFLHTCDLLKGQIWRLERLTYVDSLCEYHILVRFKTRQNLIENGFTMRKLSRFLCEWFSYSVIHIQYNPIMGSVGIMPRLFRTTPLLHANIRVQSKLWKTAPTGRFLWTLHNGAFFLTILSFWLSLSHSFELSPLSNKAMFSIYVKGDLWI